MTAQPQSRPDRSVYRVRRAYFARAFGRLAVAGAVLLLVTTLALSLAAPGAVTALLVVLTTVALVGAAVVAVSLVLPPTMLQLDAQGFRASKRFTSGPRQAPWEAVRGAASQEGPDGWVLLIQHSDGQHTAVPLSVVDASAVTVERDVRDRLNEAHGYRSMP